MNIEEKDIVGAAILQLEEGDLPTAVSEDMINAFNTQLPENILAKKVKALLSNEEDIDVTSEYASFLDDLPTSISADDSTYSTKEKTEEEILDDIYTQAQTPDVDEGIDTSNSAEEETESGQVEMDEVEEDLQKERTLPPSEEHLDDFSVDEKEVIQSGNKIDSIDSSQTYPDSGDAVQSSGNVLEGLEMFDDELTSLTTLKKPAEEPKEETQNEGETDRPFNLVDELLESAKSDLPDETSHLEEPTITDASFSEVEDVDKLEEIAKESISDSTTLDVEDLEGKGEKSIPDTTSLEIGGLEDLKDLEQSTELSSNNFDKILDAETEEEDKNDYLKALNRLKTFKQENRNIIYLTLTQNLVREDIKNRVFDGLRKNEDEEILVRLIYDNLLNKDKLKGKQKDAIQKIKKRLLPIFFHMGLVIAGLILIVVLSSFIFLKTRKYIVADDLYQQGYEAMEEFNYKASEDLFLEAKDLWPRLKECSKYAKKYIEQGRYYDAEKKYLQALEIIPDHFDTHLNLAKLFVIRNDFVEAEKKFIELRMLQEEKKKEKNEISVLEEMGKMYLKWGRLDSNKWGKANIIYTKLLEKGENKKLYHAKKIEISSQQKDYYQAKFHYTFLKKEDSTYIEAESFTIYLDFLTHVYKRDYSPDARTVVKKDEHLFVVQTAQSIAKNLYEKAANFLPIYSKVASWLNEIERYQEAEQIINKGLNLWEKGDASQSVNPAGMYVAGAISKYNLQRYTGSIVSLEKALEYDRQNSYAYYYLGFVNAVILDDHEGARKFFNQAKEYWGNTDDPLYYDLLARLAYNYYDNVKRNGQGSSSIKPREQLKLSLNYWMELRARRGESYLNSYAIGNAYLRLKEYDMAEAEYEISKKELEKYLPYYSVNLADLTADIKKRFEVLSDIYNNIAVAKMGKSYENRQPLANRQQAMQYLVESIELKDKMGILKGAPIANLNRVNNREVRSIDTFKIADNHISQTEE